MAIKVLLVIDDDPGYRDLLQFEMSSEGYTVLAAAGGKQAIEMLANEKVDFVVTDMKMPGMDGLDTIVEIKKTHPDIPILLTTGYAVEDRLEEAMKLAKSTYLRKPFDMGELVKLVKAHEKKT